MVEGTRYIYNLEQVYVQVGDQYPALQAALQLPLLDPSASLDQETSFRLGLITAFQFAESLDDPAAAQATSHRKDWRYALHLPIRHPGFPTPLLCKFRASLYFSAQAVREFEQMLVFLRKIGLFSVQANVDDAEKVISRVCGITHFTLLKQSMKIALSSMAASEPEWLRAHALPQWYQRYQTGRLEQSVDLSDQEIQQEAVRLGKEIQYLLKTINEQGMARLANQTEIRALAGLFHSQFLVMDDEITWQVPMRTLCNCNRPGLRPNTF